MVEDREEAVKIIGQNANTFYFVFCLHLCSEASKKNRLAKKKERNQILSNFFGSAAHK